MADDALSEEDKDLFREAMSKVKPLASKNITPKQKNHLPPSVKKLTPKIEPKVPSPTRHLSGYIVEEVYSNSVLSYCQSDFPKQRMRDLMRGKIPWQAKLDLHGYQIDEADARLSSFISRNYTSSIRSLLIIHGKGGYNHQAPILKNRLNRFLPQFEEVLAFHSALPKDGGLGAVYVLLKRLRDQA